MRHLLLAGGLEVALVVCCQPGEERRGVDDVRVRRDRERLGDLRCTEDRDIAASNAASPARSTSTVVFSMAGVSVTIKL
jgi:hypothetical protein